MKPSRYLYTTALPLLAVLTGCATGFLATPHQHFAMRPDLSVAELLGTWEPVPAVDPCEQFPAQSEPFRFDCSAEGKLLLHVASASYEVRLIPYANQANRFLAEIQQVKLGDIELTDGLSVIAVISIEGNTLSIWYLNGIKLAEAMREDGHSGNFQHHLLVSEIDADPQDMIQTIDAHAAELLNLPMRYRAIEEPQELIQD
jgi:hypothetical protein